jgi:HK97 family phage prohead protease
VTQLVDNADHLMALREAGRKRRERFEREGQAPDGQTRSGIMLPNGAARRVSTKDLGKPAQLRTKNVERDGKLFHLVEGYFTIYERGYEMWDWAGPYTETVSRGAVEKTIADGADVVFLINHGGLALARTAAGTLELWSDETGGGNRVWLNPQRQDVKDLVAAVDDKTVTEQSFAFMITTGEWSTDYTEFRIHEVNMDRGDTSAVNYGANPYTSIAARSREILDALDHLPAGAARAALDRLQHRPDLDDEQQKPAAVLVGRGSIAKYEAMLNDDD